MSEDVSIRELFTYQTDDARRIEEWRKIGSTTYTPDDDEEKESVESVLNIDNLFIGVVQIMLPQIGPKEVRFRIEATTLKEAFDKYGDLAKDVEEEMEKQFNNYIRNANQQILRAPADIMDQLNNPSELNNTGQGSIITL